MQINLNQACKPIRRTTVSYRTSRSWLRNIWAWSFVVGQRLGITGLRCSVARPESGHKSIDQ